MIEHFGSYLLTLLPSCGYYGVDLFFVISGFLITLILLKSTGTLGKSFKTFMGRRVLRIFPVYYMALAVLWLFSFENTRDEILWLLTYTWNYRAAQITDENPLFYLWSLSVEEQFYVFWPPIVLCLRGKPRCLMTVTMFLISVSYAQLISNIFPTLSTYNYTGLINRMGSLCLGAAGAVAFRRNWIPRRMLTSVWLEVLMWCVLAWAFFATTSLRLPFLGLCSLMLVLKAVQGDFAFAPIRWALSHPWAIFIGQISYGIYVFHWPLGLTLNEYVFDPIWLNIDFATLGPFEKLRWHSWVIKFPLYYAIIVGVAGFSFRYIESPLLNLKDRWFPNRPIS